MESEYHIAPQPARDDATSLRQPRAAKPDARTKLERAPSAARERLKMVPTDAAAHPTCKNCLVPIKLCHCGASKGRSGSNCARCAELEQELGAERRAAQLDSQSRALEQEAHATEMEGLFAAGEARVTELEGEARQLAALTATLP
mgnify:CR=1 FL=1|jgi:hypothetical protein